MTTEAGDVQSRKILQGLALLESLVEEPLPHEVLDIDHNRDTYENLDQMLRMKRSLTQYVERAGDLLYVGLLGHFSSGKSSTINSLLGLLGSPEERQVGLNPTDTAITLITHPDNSPSLSRHG
jgi:ribosome biogenesis GTPase A